MSNNYGCSAILAIIIEIKRDRLTYFYQINMTDGNDFTV